MSKIENYLGIANHDIQTANNSQELKSYVASILCEIDELLEENQSLKKQLEEYQLQNIDLRADIMIQKKAFPNKLIKDKTFYDLYDMPTYEELLVQQKEFINYLEKEINEHKNKEPFIVANICSSYDLTQIELNILKDILQKYKSIIGEHNG